MSRFDVYEANGRHRYLLDVQADVLHELPTRVVIPLMPTIELPVPQPRLYPRFEVRGSSVVLATHFIAAVPRKLLKTRVSSLHRQATSVLDAIDFLHQGW